MTLRFAARRHKAWHFVANQAWHRVTRTLATPRNRDKTILKDVQNIKRQLCAMFLWVKGKTLDFITGHDDSSKSNLTSVGGARFPLRFMAAPQVFHTAVQRAVALAKTAPVRTKPPA